MSAGTYATGIGICYHGPRPETVPHGKPFATSQPRMDDTSFVYWPHSPDGPGCEPGDIDAFIDRMLELTGETRRRLHAPAGHHVPRRHKSDDAADPPPKIDLVLYTSAASEKSQKALRAVREVLAQYGLVPGEVLNLRPLRASPGR